MFDTYVNQAYEWFSERSQIELILLGSIALNSILLLVLLWRGRKIRQLRHLLKVNQAVLNDRHLRRDLPVLARHEKPSQRERTAEIVKEMAFTGFNALVTVQTEAINAMKEVAKESISVQGISRRLIKAPPPANGHQLRMTS